jgi:hypothetical protein
VNGTQIRDRAAQSLEVFGRKTAANVDILSDKGTAMDHRCESAHENEFDFAGVQA